MWYALFFCIYFYICIEIFQCRRYTNKDREWFKNTEQEIKIQMQKLRKENQNEMLK